MKGIFFLNLTGNVSEMLFKDDDGLHCPEKYPPALRLFEASKMSPKAFSSLLTF